MRNREESGNVKGKGILLKTHRRLTVAQGILILLFTLFSATRSSATQGQAFENWVFHPRQPSVETEGFPPPRVTPIDLEIDDGSWEGTFGVGAATAQQFLWFNQFSRATDQPFRLEEIQVLFPPGTHMNPGNPVQLVVYVDPDRDPTNGAQLLATYDEAIQSVDGSTFSVYPLDPPVEILAGGDIYLGVVSRFVETGVTSPTSPAAIDSTTSTERSWVAVWTGDPPTVPNLPPDLFLDTVDAFVPGNWLIRGYGQRLAVVEIPALDAWGLGILGLLLAGLGSVVLSKRRAAGDPRIAEVK